MLQLTHLIGFGAVGAAQAAPPPTVETTNTGITASSTSVSITLPSGIAAGDLILIFSRTASAVATPPAGWSTLYQVANTLQGGCFYRVADGSEGASVSFGLSATQSLQYTNYRISGFSGAPEVATATGSSTSIDPPSLTPSWGAKENLWIAAAHAGADMSGGAPANYTDLLVASGTVAINRLKTARRFLNAESENPGTYAQLSTVWVAGTVAVQPV